ncbi:MAG: hydantoinase/oxoprolinase family protein [Chloroflexi bacterium]|nr:hydantoinase/oxoprolinase family protein [Chloroflexota bacterium]
MVDPATACVVAADIGGTFTDLVVSFADGTLITHKVLSTPDDYSRAIARGMERLLASAGVPAERTREVCHGTTLGTNAVLERRGAATGLITTKGFRDVLEIRRIRFPEPYNVQWEKPEPLVPRELRMEVTERIASDGGVVTPPDAAEAAAAIRALVAAGVQSIAVALINAYANPAHEEWLAAQVAALAPGCSVTVSSRLLPEMGEYERTSTAVANAYLAPIMERYLGTLRRRLDDVGSHAPLFVAQSNGGLFLHTFAVRKPFLSIESGPAAGCVAARQLARDCGYGQLIAVDMGGTTTKASFVADGELAWASEMEIGAPLSVASRLQKGGGYAIRCPIIDLAEVGAGGGSIAWVDRAGLLHVGPHSAGAMPGPACYGQGGAEATLTDANVVLGYINPHALAGGTFAIDPDKAHAAVARLAERLDKSVEETAYGIHVIANSNMMAAIRAVSTQRGKDIRHVDMLAFGGSGPVQAVGLAASLSMRRVIVPPFPGLFSCFGLLIADVEHHLMRGFVSPLDALDRPDTLAALNAALADMEAEVRDELRAAGYDAEVLVERAACLKLEERSGEVLLPLPPGRLGPAELDDLRQRFLVEYGHVYRHVPAGALPEVLNVRVVGRVRRAADPGRAFRAARPQPGPSVGTERGVYFGPQVGHVVARVHPRDDLRAAPLAGPLIIEEADSSTIVQPGWQARLDAWGNIVVER